MKNYIGLVSKENENYGIIFPDFLGCISVGNTIEEVYKNGIEALSLHINGIKEDKKEIPEPRTLEEIKQSNEDWYDFKNSIIMFIPYIPEQDKYVRINITINQTLLNKIDSISKNRSAFISQMAEKYFGYGYVGV